MNPRIVSENGTTEDLRKENEKLRKENELLRQKLDYCNYVVVDMGEKLKLLERDCRELLGEKTDGNE